MAGIGLTMLLFVTGLAFTNDANHGGKTRHPDCFPVSRNRRLGHSRAYTPRIVRPDLSAVGLRFIPIKTPLKQDARNRGNANEQRSSIGRVLTQYDWRPAIAQSGPDSIQTRVPELTLLCR